MSEHDRTYYRAQSTTELIRLGKEARSELTIAIAERLEDNSPAKTAGDYPGKEYIETTTSTKGMLK